MCFLQRHVFSFVCLPTGLSNSCQDFLSLTVWLPELLLVLLISVDLFLPLLSFLFLYCVGRMHFFLYPAILQPGLFLISGNAWCAWLLFAWFCFQLICLGVLIQTWIPEPVHLALYSPLCDLEKVNLSVPRFPYLLIEYNDCTCLVGLWWRFSWGLM